MKKYYGVFFATFAFALNFLCFWYSDFLINRYFIFGLIPLCLAIIVLIASMIILIVFVVRNKNRLSSCISLGISIISVLLSVAHYEQTWHSSAVTIFQTSKLNLRMAQSFLYLQLYWLTILQALTKSRNFFLFSPVSASVRNSSLSIRTSICFWTVWFCFVLLAWGSMLP